VIEYTDILNSIKKCNGSLVTILHDSIFINDEFLKFITQELSNEYKIEYDRYDIKTIDVKTIIVIKVSNIPRINNSIGNRSILFRSLIGNKNVILIALKSIDMYMASSNSLYGEEMYASNIVFQIKNKKLTIVKSRYSELHNTDSLDISNIIKKVRRNKINKINKINDVKIK